MVMVGQADIQIKYGVHILPGLYPSLWSGKYYKLRSWYCPVLPFVYQNLVVILASIQMSWYPDIPSKSTHAVVSFHWKDSYTDI